MAEDDMVTVEVGPRRFRKMRRSEAERGGYTIREARAATRSEPVTPTREAAVVEPEDKTAEAPAKAPRARKSGGTPKRGPRQPG